SVVHADPDVNCGYGSQIVYVPLAALEPDEPDDVEQAPAPAATASARERTAAPRRRDVRRRITAVEEG
ncbi:MAG: hypothetical protein ACRDSS_07170, partial [Actinocrinis sp.]